MGLSDFAKYMHAYAQMYYEKFSLNIENIGDVFYGMRDDGELYRWLEHNGKFYTYNKINAPAPPIHVHGNIKNVEQLPAYSVALQELFYQEFDFCDLSGQSIQRKHGDITQEDIANVCHVARNTVSCWKSGTRMPGKYYWWALAIGKLKLDYQYLPPYLDMIGCTVDMTCLDDVLLYYALCSEKTKQDTYLLLKAFDCTSILEIFAPLDSV